MNDYAIHENNKNPIGINEVYTFFLVLSPILFLYGVGLGSLTLSDMILIILNVLLLFKGLIQGKINIYINLLPFLIYILVLTLSIGFDMDVLLRSFRYIFYIFNIIFFVKSYFNYHFGIKVYRVVSLVSTGFLFLQVLSFRVLGIYIPGVILSANLTASDLYEYNSVLQNAQFKRFMSFFEEPSHFAIYILGYITILLFSKMNISNFRKKYIFEFCFLSAGIALSTSILGVMVLGAMLSIWFVTNIFKNKKSFIRMVSFIFVMAISLILISQTTAFDYFTNSSIVNRQSEGRFNGYSLLIEETSDIFTHTFGNGMVKIDQGIYLPSYPLLIYYFGYFGLLLFILAFIPYFMRSKLNVSAALLICLLGISLGSEILLGRFILVFLPLIITAKVNLKNLEH